jgi:hypothetical protein
LISYTRQKDGTFLKEGSFAVTPKEVRLQIGDAPPFENHYTLEQAVNLIEEGIRKNQVKKDLYRILPMPEVEKPKVVKEPKPPREPKVKVPKEPKAPKYDLEQFVTIYQNTKSIKDVCTATGASYSFVQRTLIDRGLYQKQVKVPLTPEEKAKRKEERKAANPEAKGRVPKYNVDQFVEIYKATGSHLEVMKQTGASKDYVVRSLTKRGVFVKPVRAPKAS